MPQFNLFGKDDEKIPANAWHAEWDDHRFSLKSACGKVNFDWDLPQMVREISIVALLMGKCLRFRVKDSVTIQFQSNKAFARELWDSLKVHLFRDEEMHRKVVSELRANLYFGPILSVVCGGILAGSIVWLVARGNEIPPTVAALRRAVQVLVVFLALGCIGGVADFVRSFAILRRLEREERESHY
jgi:hypothetical protein